MLHDEFIQELAALDNEEQSAWKDGVEAGEDHEELYQKIRDRFRKRFLGIIKKYNEEPKG